MAKEPLSVECLKGDKVSVDVMSVFDAMNTVATRTRALLAYVPEPCRSIADTGVSSIVNDVLVIRSIIYTHGDFVKKHFGKYPFASLSILPVFRKTIETCITSSYLISNSRVLLSYRLLSLKDYIKYQLEQYHWLKGEKYFQENMENILNALNDNLIEIEQAYLSDFEKAIKESKDEGKHKSISRRDAAKVLRFNQKIDQQVLKIDTPYSRSFKFAYMEYRFLSAFSHLRSGTNELMSIPSEFRAHPALSVNVRQNIFPSAIATCFASLLTLSGVILSKTESPPADEDLDLRVLMAEKWDLIREFSPIANMMYQEVSSSLTPALAGN